MNSSSNLATLTVNNAANYTFAGVIGLDNSGKTYNQGAAYGPGTGNIALVKSNTGILTLTGNNTYTGGTTLSSGWISVGNNSA